MCTALGLGRNKWFGSRPPTDRGRPTGAYSSHPVNMPCIVLAWHSEFWLWMQILYSCLPLSSNLRAKAFPSLHPGAFSARSPPTHIILLRILIQVSRNSDRRALPYARQSTVHMPPLTIQHKIGVVVLRTDYFRNTSILRVGISATMQANFNVLVRAETCWPYSTQSNILTTTSRSALAIRKYYYVEARIVAAREARNDAKVGA